MPSTHVAITGLIGTVSIRTSAKPADRRSPRRTHVGAPLRRGRVAISATIALLPNSRGLWLPALGAHAIREGSVLHRPPMTDKVERSTTSRRRIAAEIVVSILVGGVAPYVAYVLLRPTLAEVPALMIGAMFPAALELVSLARHRRLDPLSTLNLVALAVSVALVASGGSARFILIKESLVTGAIGVGFLASALLARPAHFYLSRQFMTGNLPERVARYNLAWEKVPYMHTVLRTTTVVWGAAFVIEVVVRLVLVFRLSTQQMLAVGPILFYAMLLAVIVWTVAYARRARPRVVAMLEQAQASATV